MCKKCYEKHNSHNKYGPYPFAKESELSSKELPSKPLAESLPEHFCNLCQKPFSAASELEEHLIEHSFRGCEDRGYNCYICSAIFTLPSGLHQHMIEHGPRYRPYDCNLCTKKFYFRAELENHLVDHESGRVETPRQTQIDTHSNGSKSVHLKHEPDNEHSQTKLSNDDSTSEKDRDAGFKIEPHKYSSEENAEDDDEYIEVEQIGESASVQVENRTDSNAQNSDYEDQREKYDRNDDD